MAKRKRRASGKRSGPASKGAGKTGSSGSDLTRFACCFCKASLKVKPVAKRTRIQCPKCSGQFYLFPDGSVEDPNAVQARIMRAELDSGSEPEDDGAETSEETRRKARKFFDSGDFDGTGTGIVFETVHGFDGSALAELRRAAGVEPVKDPDAAKALTSDPGYRLFDDDEAPLVAMTATRRFNYVIMPESSEEEPGEGAKRPPLPGLGDDPQKRSEKPKDGKKRKKKKKKDTGRRRAEEVRDKAPAPFPPPSEDRPPSISQTNSIEREKRSLRRAGVALGIIVVIPLIFSLLFLASTLRDRGFATRGELGRKLEDLGRSTRRGVVRLNRATLKLDAIDRGSR